MEIGEMLAKSRKARGLTQLDVANAVGVSEATVSRWESGNIANMRRDKIAALARVLNLTPAQIMGWEEWAADLVEVLDNTSKPFKASFVVGKNELHIEDESSNGIEIIVRNETSPTPEGVEEESALDAEILRVIAGKSDETKRAVLALLLKLSSGEEP